MRRSTRHTRTRFHPLAARARNGGYTLLEIMLVVGIIMVLLGSAVFFMTGSMDIGKSTAAKGDIRAIETQLKTFEILQRRPPTNEQGLDALVTRPADLAYPSNWKQLFEKVPDDPWGNPYQYRYPAQKSQARQYDVWSMGPDRQPDTEDDIGNWD